MFSGNCIFFCNIDNVNRILYYIYIMKFNEKLRAMRIEMRMTQFEYAKRIGISVYRLRNFEYAKTVLSAEIYQSAVDVYNEWLEHAKTKKNRRGF